MSDSKDYNTAGNAITGAENSNLSGDSRIGSGSDKNSSGSSSKRSSRKSSSSSSSSSSNSNTGSSKSKMRSRIKLLKKLACLGFYAWLMLLSVSRMMDERLMSSFWFDVLAFAVLWVYYALSSLKLIRLFKVSKMWFYSHALVILIHLAVALFLGDVDPNAGVAAPVHAPVENQPVVQPY